jgi:hypothetical protein
LLRDRLGPREGSEIELQEGPEGVMLKPAEKRRSMVQKQGLWVHTGRLSPGFDIAHAVREDREERIGKPASL